VREKAVSSHTHSMSSSVKSPLMTALSITFLGLIR